MAKSTSRASTRAAKTYDGSPENLSDAELVQRVLAGRREWFQTLVERYRKKVYSLAYSILSNWQDAQDVAQEAFFSAYRRLPDLRDPKKFGAWLFGTTRHLCYVALREKRVIGEHIPVEQIGSAAAGPPQEEAQDDQLALMLAAMEDLPDKYQLLLRLKYLGGYSYREIAQLADVPEVTVKSRLFEGRRMLRERVESYLRKSNRV